MSEFIFSTSFNTSKLYLRSSAIVINADTSLGKQEPPYQMPALRNDFPMRESRHMPYVTWSIFALDNSQIRARAFANEIFIAKNELLACLISSALFTLVSINGALIGS